MTTQLSPTPIFKAFDNVGLPLSFGLLYTYQAGTTTPQATYTDSTGNTPNPNPVLLNARGEAQIWLNPLQNYKFLLTDALGNQIPGWPVDNISGSLYPGQSIIPNTDNAFDIGSLSDRWRNGYFGTQIFVGPNNAPIVDSSGNVGYWARTAAEIAAGVTPVNFAYAPGTVLRYGTNSTPGTTDMTTAFMNAIAQWGQGGEPVYAPAGTYLVGTLHYPNGFGFVFKGDGPTQTALVANANNIPVFQKVQIAGSMDYASFSGFAIKAYASAGATSTTTAFDCSGMRSGTIEKVFGLSNAGGFGFASLFSMSAFPYLCYGNRHVDCGLAQQTGWTKAWDFNNGGTSNALNNANDNRIENPWIYFNTGLSIGIDALRSAQVAVMGGLIEHNTGASAIKSGTMTTVQNVWIESNAHGIVYSSAVDGTANDGLAIGNYFSTADTVDFTGCQGNAWIGNTEAGNQTWTNNNGTNVRFKGSTDAQIAPTVAQSAGGTGTLTLGSATLLDQPNLANELSYILQYTWTPTTAATFSQFTLTCTNNWQPVALSVGMTRNASGQPRATAINGVTSSTATFSTDNVTNDAHALTILARVKHIDP